MTVTAPETSSSKPGRGMRWLLVGSLALNLLVVGAIAGAFVKGGPGGGLPPGERTLNAPYIKAFEIKDKRAMRAEMRKRMPGRREMIDQNKRDYAAFISLLRAEHFDAEAARAVMQTQLSRTAETLNIGQAIAFEHIASMSAQDRSAYADRLEGHVAQMGKKRAHKKGKRDGD